MTPDTQLSPHFALSEFTNSQTASRHGIRNEPMSNQIANLQRVALMLEDVRVALQNAPILISSGFRSPMLNSMVGGASDSAHLDGRAADFTAPAFGCPRLICQRIIDVGINFDQLIMEGTWVHLGLAVPDGNPRREVLTARFNPGAPTTYGRGLL